MNCPHNGKIKYGSEREAEKALGKMRQKYSDSEGHEPYFCMYCEHWHLGSKKKPQKKKRKRT